MPTSELPAPPPPITLATLIAPGIAAICKFWRPFVLLQSAALLLVVGYYTSHQVQLACEQLSEFKDRAGLIFSAISAAIAGALLPELAKAIMINDRTIDRQRVGDVTFALIAFAINGVITDLQYRGMAWAIGHDARFITVVEKMLADQFITTPIYGIPYWVIIYSLRAHRYDVLATLGQISPRWYVRRVLPLLIPAWAFWMPMVLLIYSLPGPLQFCLFLFAVGAWSLLMVFVASA